MIDIYKTWITDFGIDGFRIDTMKHVDDEFWQEFGPGVLDYARRTASASSSCSARSSTPTKSFTSHFTTHDKMQAILDFPFQDAARNFASKRPRRQRAGDFFDDDDWYTDADSNVYQLPTFLGNHDMGRIGCFLRQRQPGRRRRRAARPRPARPRADVLLARQPGRLLRRRAGLHRRRGGDQLARQTMFASQVAGLPRRRPDRHRRAPHAQRQLRHRAPALPARSATSPR